MFPESLLQASAGFRKRSFRERAKKFLRRNFLTLLAVPLLLLVLYYGFKVEPYRLQYRTQALHFARYPKDAAPLKIAVLSDLHVTDFWLAKLPEIVQTINAEHCDAVFLLGDYVTAYSTPDPLGVFLRDILPKLGQFQSRCGTFLIRGNHEPEWRNAPNLQQAVQQYPTLHLLQDQVVPLQLSNEKVIDLIGFDHSIEPEVIQYQRLQRLRGNDEERFRIVLAHSPDLFATLPAHSIDLMLSGHTHGGQVRLPILGSIIVPSRHSRKFSYGKLQQDGNTLLVTCGLGAGQSRFRLGVPPEVLFLEISR